MQADSPSEPLKQPNTTVSDRENLVEDIEKPQPEHKQRSWFKFLAFPLATWFIIGNEFCERFAFYGIL